MQHCVVGTALGAAAGLGRWFVWVAVLLLCRDFQRRRQHSATTTHRALLPVCEWLVLSMKRGNASSNADSAVCSRCDGACTGGCGRAGQVFCGGCGFTLDSARVAVDIG